MAAADRRRDCHAIRARQLPAARGQPATAPRAPGGGRPPRGRRASGRGSHRRAPACWRPPGRLAPSVRMTSRMVRPASLRLADCARSASTPVSGRYPLDGCGVRLAASQTAIGTSMSSASSTVASRCSVSTPSRPRAASSSSARSDPQAAHRAAPGSATSISASQCRRPAASAHCRARLEVACRQRDLDRGLG